MHGQIHLGYSNRPHILVRTFIINKKSPKRLITGAVMKCKDVSQTNRLRSGALQCTLLAYATNLMPNCLATKLQHCIARPLCNYDFKRVLFIPL